MTMRNRNEEGGRAKRPLIGYYGDDFTGSTDVLEALFRQGLRTLLFLEAPDEARLAGFGRKSVLNRGRGGDGIDGGNGLDGLSRSDELNGLEGLDAFGIAGVGRSLSPEEMERELPPIFERLKQAGPAIIHYKICSTFDSSPDIGSIGKAAELGWASFGGGYIPVIAGVPYLGRYTVFGHHFAAAPDGEVHRLDRHPTMSRHPVTPMDESDLRKHLERQTSLKSSLLDIVALDGGPSVADARLERILSEENPDLLLIDVLDERRLAVAGQLLLREAGQREDGLFVIGSSGVEYALGAAWQASGELPTTFSGSASATSRRTAKPVDRLLVVSGSCSPATAKQIAEAEEDGFAAIRVPALELIRPERAEEARARLLAEAEALLETGRSVILYSASGPDDPGIGSLRQALAEQGRRPEESSRLLGAELGGLARALAASAGLTRILIAGGDTSGYVARALGIYALECVQALAPGAPLCRAYSDDDGLDGLELVLKGGQVGGERFFDLVKRGGETADD
ncbi:four-carbon acid sugar kinase family protein [Cohnella fermenti]|uniref:Four-carbon acid sugar kinase family protein n=1 Tax=Cohnella fermenti TaxID=2565925 RepID=A0A4S4BYQ4_9BACL|nr:four-carbon acid sugar kinase family protein [Cohnella fermenti]THF79862.1 four-carbon acid sugar kinase family protein [Cohnella fermenti]